MSPDEEGKIMNATYENQMNVEVAALVVRTHGYALLVIDGGTAVATGIYAADGELTNLLLQTVHGEVMI